MQVIVIGFVGWLQMRGANDPRLRVVDGLLTVSAGLLIVLGVYVGAQL